MNTDSLTLQTVMIHEVPRGGSDGEPTLTDSPVDLDDTLDRYFTDKVTRSLDTRGVDVVADPTGDATVRTAICEILKDPASHAHQSRQIARHLTATQNAHNPPGLLAVISVVTGATPAIAVIKLERESGIRFGITQEGRYATVTLELLRQLTLTNKTRIFKTAILTAKDSGDSLTLFGKASDNQRGLTEGRGVADFYLGTFLGCTVAENPARATKVFAEAVTQYVSETDLSAETRGRYTVALLSELHSNRVDISPRQFMQDHIGLEHRAGLTQKLQNQNIDVAAAFQKDTTLVPYDKIRFTFESGLTLVGQSEDIDNHVRVRGPEEPPGVDINDAIDSIKGR